MSKMETLDMGTTDERKPRATINRRSLRPATDITKPTFDDNKHDKKQSRKITKFFFFFIALDMQKAMKMEGRGRPSQERGIVP